ncbi:MAG: CBS domain-containing protein [Thermoplasmata archaeon]
MSAPLVTDLLRPFLVEEVMTAPVYTAGPNESLLSAARTMRGHHVSGLPVVDAKGRVLGVLSEKDIVGALDHQVGIGHARGILDVLLAGYEPKRKDMLQRSVAALLNGVVKDAMSHPAATVDEDAPLSEAWHLLRQFSINRLPVVRGDRLSGILTRQDVLKVLESSPPSTVPAGKKTVAKRRVRA